MNLIPILLILSSSVTVNGVIHTEGGSFARNGEVQSPSPYSSSDGDFDERTDDIELQPAHRNPSGGGQRLANIIGEISQARHNQPMIVEEEEEAVPLELLIEAAKQQQRDRMLARERAQGNNRNTVNFLGQYGPAGESAERDPNEEEIEELRKFGREFSELQHGGSVRSNVEYEPQAAEVDEQGEPGQSTVHQPLKPKQNPAKAATKPITEQKKGQSEFVGYVEPPHVKVASKLKNLEFMEKRVADSDLRMRSEEDDERDMFGLISTSSNVLFIAFITMCCALTVVGVVGGTYYYKHIRPDREDPFDDFTRYSPAGPGKHLKSGLSNFVSGEKGDDALAYRAQLHHYQQTKQKIIGSGDDTLGSPGRKQCGVGAAAITDDETDKSEDEGELEHNYSVYECPGLAPTGDIEVQNPNFVDSAASGGKHHRVSSPQSPQQRNY